MSKVARFMALFIMMGLIAAFVFCYRSETFHRLASPEEKITLSEKTKFCLTCHEEKYIPFVFDNWKQSKHAQKGIGCEMCHITEKKELQDEIKKVIQKRMIADLTIQNSKCDVETVNHVVPAKICGECHEKQLGEFSKSKHGQAWSSALVQQHQELDKDNQFIKMKDCASCHQIEFKCNACHGAHNFSLSEARQPEHCGACHSGNSHEQFEQYIKSRHGYLYITNREDWNLGGSLEEWRENSKENAYAPVCVTCHMPDGVHDVHHPEMKNPNKWICSKCHSSRKRDPVQLNLIKHDSIGVHVHTHALAKKAKEAGIPICLMCHKG